MKLFYVCVLDCGVIKRCSLTKAMAPYNLFVVKSVLLLNTFGLFLFTLLCAFLHSICFVTISYSDFDITLLFCIYMLDSRNL